MPELGAEARVGAQRRGRPAEHSEEVGELTAPGSAPFRTGTLRSGAVSSSWTWNLLSLVFMPLHFLRAAYWGKYREEKA